MDVGKQGPSINAPLIAEAGGVPPEPAAPRSSFAQAFANVLKVCLGSGLLAFPIAFQKAGILESVLMILVASVWVYRCVMLLIECNERLRTLENVERRSSDYSTLCYHLLGAVGSYIFEFLFISTLLGVGVVYLITSSNLLAAIHWGHRWFEGNVLIFTALSAKAISILALHRDMTSLSWSSMLGNVAIFVSLLLVTIYGLIHYGLHFQDINWYRFDMQGLSSLFGTVLFSFGIAFIALSTKHSMKQPESFQSVLRWANSSLFFFYSIFGILLYVIFHSVPIEGNIIFNIPPNSPFFIISMVLVVLMCLFSFPVAVIPAIDIIESRPYFHSDQTTGRFVRSPKRIVFRTVLVLVLALISYFVPKFDLVVSFLGCVTISSVTFTLPPLLHFLLFRKEASRAAQAADVTLAVLGVATFVFTTVQTVLGALSTSP